MISRRSAYWPSEIKGTINLTATPIRGLTTPITVTATTAVTTIKAQIILDNNLKGKARKRTNHQLATKLSRVGFATKWSYPT